MKFNEHTIQTGSILIYIPQAVLVTMFQTTMR